MAMDLTNLSLTYVKIVQSISQVVQNATLDLRTEFRSVRNAEIRNIYELSMMMTLFL